MKTPLILNGTKYEYTETFITVDGEKYYGITKVALSKDIAPQTCICEITMELPYAKRFEAEVGNVPPHQAGELTSLSVPYVLSIYVFPSENTTTGILFKTFKGEKFSKILDRQESAKLYRIYIGKVTYDKPVP